MLLRSRLASSALCLVLGGCVAAPPQRSMSPSAPASGEFASEYQRLHRLAEERHEAQRERVERVARRLLGAMPNPPEVQFIVVPGDPSVNAGATFGQVAVTSGMLEFVDNDDELAVVLGHELAHITEGHVTKGVIGGVALNVLAILAEVHAPGAGQAVGGVGQLFLNRFTQGQERDADEVGIGYAYNAGYDPIAAVAVQEKLAVEVPQSMAAGYFNTHPSSVERAINAKARANELLAAGPPPGREAVLAESRAAVRATRDAGGERPPRGSRGDDGGYAIGGGDAPDRDDERPRVTSYEPARSSGGCPRGRVYRDMAADARTAEERAALLERAERACPAGE